MSDWMNLKQMEVNQLAERCNTLTSQNADLRQANAELVETLRSAQKHLRYIFDNDLIVESRDIRRMNVFSDEIYQALAKHGGKGDPEGHGVF